MSALVGSFHVSFPSVVATRTACVHRTSSKTWVVAEVVAGKLKRLVKGSDLPSAQGTNQLSIRNATASTRKPFSWLLFCPDLFALLCVFCRSWAKLDAWWFRRLLENDQIRHHYANDNSSEVEIHFAVVSSCCLLPRCTGWRSTKQSIRLCWKHETEQHLSASENAQSTEVWEAPAFLPYLRYEEPSWVCEAGQMGTQ